MNISQAGLDLIKRFEGLRLKAYTCSAGRWTIGYGSTLIWGRTVRPDDQITEAQAEDFFRQDVDKFCKIANDNIAVQIDQSMFDAFVSILYNVGPGAKDVRDGIITLKSGRPSTLLRLLNAGDFHGAADQFLQWNKVNGVENAGLVRRRAAERAMFLETLQPHKPTAAFPQYPGTVTEEPKMIPAPLLIAGAQALLPFVADLFKKHGGSTAERNAEIVEKSAPILIEAAKAATGQTSLEGAISAVAGSSVAQEQFRKQVESRWFEIQEAGGGGIEGARKFNLDAAGTPFWMMPAFWVSMALLPLLYGTVWMVLSGAEPGFSGELKAAISSSVVTGVLGAIVGFWLGSSFTTSRSRGLGATPTQS